MIRKKKHDQTNNDEVLLATNALNPAVDGVSESDGAREDVVDRDSAENGIPNNGVNANDSVEVGVPDNVLNEDVSGSEDNGAVPEVAKRAEETDTVNPVFIELQEKASRKRRHVVLNSVRSRTIWERFVLFLFFSVMAFAAIVALFPIVLTVLNSFMSSAEIETNYGAILRSLPGYNSQSKTYLVSEPVLNFIPDMVSFEQYTTLLFKSPAYLFKFWNSIILVVPIVLGQLAVGSLAAYSFARYRRRRREILFFSYIILMLMPFQVTLVPNYIVAQRLNIFDSWAAIILPGVFSTFSVFLLTKYMRQIPSSYIEAAKLDGAGEWHIFWHICIPTCKSALYAISILLFIDYWNMVEQPLLLLENTDKHPLSVFLSQINQKEMGIAFAASFVFMIPPLLMFFYGEQYLIEGISRSGIK